MPITLLDGILIGFTLVSAILAMVRGFSREVLSIASWVAAAFGAYFFYPLVLPYVQPHVGHDTLALAVAAGIVFLIVFAVTLILLPIALTRLAVARWEGAVLLVDEIATSGETFRLALAATAPHPPRSRATSAGRRQRPSAGHRWHPDVLPIRRGAARHAARDGGRWDRRAWHWSPATS